MTVRGADRHRKRLKGMRDDMARKLGTIIFVASDKIKTEARLSITRGSISGKMHVASAPFEPPNRDTGTLDSNIENTRTGPLSAEVRSQAPYAKALEFGTSKMKERPYMRPAVKKVEPTLRKDIVVGVRKVIRES